VMWSDAIVLGGGQERKRPRSFLNVAFYLMPATAYSPTHFRVQYNRPCGAIFTRDPKLLWLRPFVQADAVPSRSAGSVNRE
jgi:hypothetical protein